MNRMTTRLAGRETAAVAIDPDDDRTTISAAALEDLAARTSRAPDGDVERAPAGDQDELARIHAQLLEDLAVGTDARMRR